MIPAGRILESDNFSIPTSPPQSSALSERRKPLQNPKICRSCAGRSPVWSAASVSSLLQAVCLNHFKMPNDLLFITLFKANRLAKRCFALGSRLRGSDMRSYFAKVSGRLKPDMWFQTACLLKQPMIPAGRMLESDNFSIPTSPPQSSALSERPSETMRFKPNTAALHSNNLPCANSARTGAKSLRCSGSTPYSARAARCAAVP